MKFRVNSIFIPLLVFIVLYIGSIFSRGNMAWYNLQDQEIIATWNGVESGRVDLDMSGFRGKFEIRRYFSW